MDATVVASPFGFVCADEPIDFQLDANGDILPNTGAAAAQIYSNAELYPQNSVGLGTYYLVTIYDQNGARINKVPMWWQFTQPANSTVNISEMIPFATVGGNVIFYPTSFTIPAPTFTSLGGIFANGGAAHEWVSAINANGSVTLSQPAFSDISGQISNSQLPSGLTFGATTFSGLITAQANIQLGLTGTVSGQITLEGSTSGASTITAPAVAGTITNPILFTNSINIPSGTVFSINTDTGISRTSAGIIAVGNGTAGNASGSVSLAALTASGLITAQGNIQLGVAGSVAGAITLEGSTSGSCSITAPAVAGTITNPIVSSNSLEIPTGGVYQIGTDTGISRASAGVIDVGNGTQGNASGTVNAAGYQVAGTAIAASNLSNGVTGTGAVVLAASPTITGTLSAAAVSASGQISASALVANGATPTGALSGVAFGDTTGFGNGTPATAVTTTTLGTGSGPTTPQTVVGYLEINVGGTNFWIPYFS